MSDLLRLERVTCHYGSGRVLDDVDLPIAVGSFIGVVGPSGSGKTTLLKAITGAVRPVAGQVWRRSEGVTIGYVPQVETVNWHFPVTVREAVLMASVERRRLPWASKDEVREADRLLEMLGLGTVAGRHIRALSGGQQQRVFIARAMLKRPDLLLLDEPTSGVDVRTRHDVVHLLHELHHDGFAILVTTHDLNGIAAHVPELVCLNHEVIAHGRPADVLTPGVLERTYGAPMEVLTHGGMPVVVDVLEPDDLLPPSRGEGHHEHPA